ncbi:FAD/NAD(P)-binding domain-containing protein [Pleurotus eryngii]|uniref:FAD/NAD(P)-binding domain-containing protein n=1 Tax=Pleurotus eryngii TaxID=5323 RepID=A0A9P5ZMG6_PLEER|nr:FAD/NAD(P)-binding domain-containing protein [Pleurotus eryngii]
METQVTFNGAGVGGLALAAFISRNPQIKVVVYESKPEVSAAGEAIAIRRRSWQVLQDMGLDEGLAKRNFPKEGEGRHRSMQYRKTHQELVVRGPIYRKSDQKEDGYDFHSHLTPSLGDVTSKTGSKLQVLTSKRARDFVVEEKSAQVAVLFSDGTRETADNVVGADGVHSTTIKWFFTDFANQQTDPVKAEAYLQLVLPKWSGTYAYRCNVSADALQAEFPGHRALTNPYLWCGQDKGESWTPKWTIFVVEGLPFSASGRIALMGDSAHAMTPHQGVGGGQAIEDAHLFGRLLAHPKTTEDNLPIVPQIYQDIRLQFAQQKAERSRLNGLIYKFNHPDFQVNSKSSRGEMEALGKAVGETFGWLAKGGCDDDWMEAEERLNKLAA